MFRLPPLNRRAVIITAAVRLAARSGLATITHGDVAKNCGVTTSRQTVQHYFPTKRDLWLVVIEADPVTFQQQGIELGVTP